MPYINESTNRIIFKDADQGGFAGNIARAAQAFANVATALPQLRMQQEQQADQRRRQDMRDAWSVEDRGIAAQDRTRNIGRQTEQDRIAAEDRARNISRQSTQDEIDAAREFDRRYPAAATWLNMPDSLTMSGGKMRSAPVPKAVVDPEDAKLIGSVDAFQRHLLDTQAQDPVMGKDLEGKDIHRTDKEGMPLYTKRPLTDKERKDRLLQQYDPQSKILSPTIRKYLFNQGNVEYVSKDDRDASAFGADSLPILRNGAGGATGDGTDGSPDYDPAALRNLELALQDPLAKRRFAPSQFSMLDNRTRPLQQDRGRESVGILQGQPSAGFTLPAMSGDPATEAPVEAAPVEAGEGAATPAESGMPVITDSTVSRGGELNYGTRAQDTTKSVAMLINGVVEAEKALSKNQFNEQARKTYNALMSKVEALPPDIRETITSQISKKWDPAYRTTTSREALQRYADSDPRLRPDPLFDIPRM